jgi:2-amino-4-hydroxy-6-hydroxymethyldihydropteridine diphosphokinase
MILIGLGANLDGPLGGPRRTLEAALARLEAPDLHIAARSRFWSSAAWPPSDQPPFVNAVARVETRLEPGALLARLHQVEAEFGRVRGVRWAARTLDLDLLAYDDAVVAPATEGGLAVPHPRLQDRAFVLLPLADVAPGWRHPIDGRSVADLIRALPPDQVAEPLPD